MKWNKWKPFGMGCLFIADREDNEHEILLYQVDGFYVEVYYHKEYNVIRKFRAFSSTNQLDADIDKMEVTNKF